METLQYSEPIKTAPETLILDIEGRRMMVMGLTDFNGTVDNDYELPEERLMESIGPAQAAFQELQENARIPIGGISARSTGESLEYRRALHLHGPTIAEDGSIVIVDTVSDAARTRFLEQGYRIDTLPEGETVIYLTDKTQEDYRSLIEEAQATDPENTIISTVTHTVEELMDVITYADKEAAERAMQRIGSAFVGKITPEQRAYIEEKAAERGIRADFSLLHLFDEKMNKGLAAEFIRDNIQALYPDLDIDGVYFIGFGNGSNDVSLMQKLKDPTLEADGIGVLVSAPDNSYAVPDDQLPPYVIKGGPYGYGILRSIPKIYSRLQQLGADISLSSRYYAAWEEHSHVK